MASVATTGLFLVRADAGPRAGGGLTGLWLAIGAFLIARLVVLNAGPHIRLDGYRRPPLTWT